VRRFVVLFVTLACGELAPEAPAPSAYAIAYSPDFSTIQIWHSATGTATSAHADAVGTACFTHDGATLLGYTHDDLFADNPPTAATFVTSGGASVVAMPGVAAWGIRGDGARLSWVDEKGLRTYDVATNAFSPILSIATGRALYAADDTTLVFARITNGASQIVTMRDDGTGEDVLVAVVSPDWVETPSFGWDGSRVVFMRTGVVSVVERATHAVQSFPLQMMAFDPHLVPDGSAVIFTTPRGNDFALARLDLATGTVDLLVDDAILGIESTQPPLLISVAPDAL
jgi:Tol biopolymer transport system component